MTGQGMTPGSGILYRGPSVLDPSSEIVAIVTGLFGSRNPKTGPMPQTWVLRTDRYPHAAIQDGSDSAVCGDCALRRDPDGNRVCYVRPDSLGSIWGAFQRGRYPAIDPYELPGMLRGRPLRLGAYGEPTAVPPAIWAAAIGDGTALGYTHQWRSVAPERWPWLMASVESECDAARAHALGWRTFRVRSGSDPLARGEIMCPASAEAGYRTVCYSCRLCDGRRTAANIAIQVHGLGRVAFERSAYVTLSRRRAA